MRNTEILVVVGLLVGLPGTTQAQTPDGFVRIEAGTFMMGSPASEPEWGDLETHHEVTLTRDFFMQTHEVTQGDYLALMGENPSNFSDCGANCPVEKVSWTDAITYANHLSAAEDLPLCYTSDGALFGVVTPYDCDGYRLPTEAEWEYAARAGTMTTYYCGDDPSCLDGIAWYDGNSGSTTHPVGQKTPNAWGLYDMSGNVWEWVWDWYERDYGTSAQTDPSGPGNGTRRVNRGGSWSSHARYLRSARRSYNAPGSRIINLGFRLARSAR